MYNIEFKDQNGWEKASKTGEKKGRLKGGMEKVVVEGSAVCQISIRRH